MITFLVVLKTGGDYDANYVERMKEMVERHSSRDVDFVCLSDDPQVPGYYPLRHNWKGWWSIIEMFRITGPVIATGLDTIITSSLAPLEKLASDCPLDSFYMCRPQKRALARGVKWSSGVMVWSGDWTGIYHDFRRAPDKNMIKFKKGGEQAYSSDWLIRKEVDIRVIQDVVPGIYSYKYHCRNSLPDDAKIIMFHGRPRPSEATAPWIKTWWGEGEG